MTMARANCRAVQGSTAAIIAPSRRWTCQSSGRRMVMCWGGFVIARTCLIAASLQGYGRVAGHLHRGAGGFFAGGLFEGLLERVGRRTGERSAIDIAAEGRGDGHAKALARAGTLGAVIGPTAQQAELLDCDGNAVGVCGAGENRRGA